MADSTAWTCRVMGSNACPQHNMHLQCYGIAPHVAVLMARSDNPVLMPAPLACRCCPALQQPYLFEWTNHLRTGAWAMTANTALLLTINMFADVEAQQQGYTQQELLAARADRSAQLTLYMFVLLPVALVVGAALSWLRLHLWVRPVVNKFRCGVLMFYAKSKLGHCEKTDAWKGDRRLSSKLLGALPHGDAQSCSQLSARHISTHPTFSPGIPAGSWPCKATSLLRASRTCTSSRTSTRWSWQHAAAGQLGACSALHATPSLVEHTRQHIGCKLLL